MTRDEEIKKLWSEGNTYGEISKALGITRSAVAGKVSRMRQKGIIGAYIVPRKVAKMPPTAPIKEPVVERELDPEPEVVMENVKHPNDCFTLLNLKSDGCRYAVHSKGTKHLFCGDTVQPGFSYCESHNKLIWIKPRSVVRAWGIKR